MVPRKISKFDEDKGLVVETEIRAVACLPLNCPGYCSVAFDEKEDFDPTGQAPDCSKPLWKFCSSRDPKRQTLNWTKDTISPWQKEVHACYEWGLGKPGNREKLQDWPPVHDLTASGCFDDSGQRKTDCFGEMDVDKANIVNTANVCRKGSTGRLCSTCLAGYEKVEGTCVSCESLDYSSIVQACATYSLMCMFFMHKSRRVVTGRDCDIHNSSSIIGISVFFVQTATLLKFNFGVQGVQSKMIGVMRMQLDDPEQDDGECLSTGDFYSDYAMKYSVQLFLLMFSAFISVAFKLKPWQQKMTLFFALQFSLVPIILRSMQIWFCRDDLHATRTFLCVDPSEECDTSNATYLMALVLLSCVIAVFAFAMPFYMYTHMKRSADAHETLLRIEYYIKYGFKKGAELIEAGDISDLHASEYAARDYMSIVYYPLRRQTFWWGIVWLLRPTLIAVFYNGRDPSSGVFCKIADWRVLVLIMLMAYNCLQASIQPFKHSNESQLDAISVLLLMLLFVLNINQDFMTATGADVSWVQVVNAFASFTVMICVLLATLMSKKATSAQIARIVARSRWNTAWNNLSSDSSDPLADVGSLVTEAETSNRMARCAKLSQLGIVSQKLPVFEQIDVDGSEMISLDEFIGWWRLRTLRAGATDTMKEVARDLFRRYDLDGSREVDRTEFEQILVGLRAWHEEQKAMKAQFEEPLEIKQVKMKGEVGRVIANMESNGWTLVGTQWTRPAVTSQLNPLHNDGAQSFEIERAHKMPVGLSAVEIAEARSDQAPTVEQIFAAIDIDNSGELSVAEFSQWWQERGGDGHSLAKTQEAFRLIELRDGVPGVTIVEFKELMITVATDTWQEAVDPASGRKYFINPSTKKSSWVAPGIECVQPFLHAARITHGVSTRPARHTSSAVPGQTRMPHEGAAISVASVRATSQAGQQGVYRTDNAVLDGLQRSKMVDKMISQLCDRPGGEIRSSNFADWWARHKLPDLPIMESLKFSRPFNKAFEARRGVLRISDVLQVLQGMWEEKHDPRTGRTYYMHIASQKSVWVFTAAEADAWMQQTVAL
jgi:Ca2+-binding EF-hand superfamily protein